MSFCSKCGFEVTDGMNFCSKCGSSLIDEQKSNQKQAHTSLDLANDDKLIPSAWNPSTIPIFVFLRPSLGVLLHHMNWKSLGRSEKQKVSLAWVVASFFIDIGYIISWIMNFMTNNRRKSPDNFLDYTIEDVIREESGLTQNTNTNTMLAPVMMLIVILFTLVWYFWGGGKEQKYYVIRNLPVYRKESWWIPIIIIIGLFMLIQFITMAFNQ